MLSERTGYDLDELKVELDEWEENEEEELVWLAIESILSGGS